MRIGMLAQATGISARALRHYEKQGLLKPRRGPNGYRYYSDTAVLQIERIRWLLAAGLSTKTIRSMLPCVLEEGPLVVECPSLRRDLTRELARLDMQIETLKRSRTLLRQVLG